MATINPWDSNVPAEVSKGMTGVTTVTAYAVLCAGTTSTGPFQSVSGLGSAGQLLTSNGASALPSWQNASGGSGTIVTTFTTSGTWTANASTKFVEVYVWSGGGGGGSGGCLTGLAGVGGGGGGSGSGYYYQRGPRASFTSPTTITIGVGGSGGAGVSDPAFIDGNPGSIGGSTSFGSVMPTPGNPGGAGLGSSNTPGDPGAPVSGYSINGTGTGTSNGTGGAPGNTGAAVDGGNALLNNCFLVPGSGGGGAGSDDIGEYAGGAGGGNTFNGVQVMTNAAGGIESGTINGANGAAGASIVANLFLGGGGGGGGGSPFVGTTSGNGGTGGLPGGGGGGGSVSDANNTSGTGGTGGDGLVIVVEYT